MRHLDGGAPFRYRLFYMKPSSLAALVFRFAAFAITLYGIFRLACSVCLRITVYEVLQHHYTGAILGWNGLYDNNSSVNWGENSLTGYGNIFGIPFGGPVTTISAIQFACSVVVIVAGVILWKLSRRLGAWVARGLE
jgi:hypothetical protein